MTASPLPTPHTLSPQAAPSAAGPAPRLSFIVPARTSPDYTADCLDCIRDAAQANALLEQSEFILLDDASEAVWKIPEVFHAFRATLPASVPVHQARFKRWQHYTGVFAYGLSVAKGQEMFFISNDYFITPAWLREMLAVAASDSRIGTVRGTSTHVDSHPEHVVVPPQMPASREELFALSEQYARARAGQVHEDKHLSGDAVIVRRALVEKIGVLDRQFFGYFGDPDFGIRARRAGFRLVCAKGAWALHMGAGHIMAQYQQGKGTPQQLRDQRMQLVAGAYARFRAKWPASGLPTDFAQVRDEHMHAVVTGPPPAGGPAAEVTPLLKPGDVEVELVP